MFPPIKQHRQVVLPKTKIPCLEKVHVPQWELVVLQAHLPAAKPTHRSGEEWQEEWKSNINNFEFRDTLLILSTSWGYEFSTLVLSHWAFLKKICYYYLLLFCSTFHVFSFYFMTQSLIPSALPPLTHELCVSALPYTCKKRPDLKIADLYMRFGDGILNWNNGTGKLMLPQRCWPGQKLLLSCLISTLRRVFLTIMRSKL